MNSKKLLLLIAIFSIVFIGCGNDDDPDPNEENGTMSASIDGVSWTAVKITLATWASSQLHIKGEASDGSLIQISLLDVDQPGTYAVGGATTVNLATYILAPGSAWTTSVITPPGTVNVTELTASGTKGTFSFTGSDAVTEKSITNGTFDIKF